MKKRIYPKTQINVLNESFRSWFFVKFCAWLLFSACLFYGDASPSIIADFSVSSVLLTGLGYWSCVLGVSVIALGSYVGFFMLLGYPKHINDEFKVEYILQRFHNNAPHATLSNDYWISAPLSAITALSPRLLNPQAIYIFTNSKLGRTSSLKIFFDIYSPIKTHPMFTHKASLKIWRDNDYKIENVQGMDGMSCAEFSTDDPNLLEYIYDSHEIYLEIFWNSNTINESIHVYKLPDSWHTAFRSDYDAAFPDRKEKAQLEDLKKFETKLAEVEQT